MITTVTLNPAIDRTMTGASLLPGRVNRMETVREYAGGKGVNVTKMLRGLGEEITGVGFLGGLTGQFILHYLSGLGVRCDYTEVPGATRTTLNLLTADGYVTEILEPGAAVPAGCEERFQLSFKRALAGSRAAVLSGSLPAGLPEDYYAGLIRFGKEQGVRMFLDASGAALAEGVRAAPFLIKPNTKELEYLMGRPLRRQEELAEAIVTLMERGLPCVVVSRGSRGLMTAVKKPKGYEIVTASAPEVPVVNTVGSGDVSVALLVQELADAPDRPDAERMERALRRAAAYASANVTTMESGIVSEETAKRLMDEVRTERFPFRRES